MTKNVSFTLFRLVNILHETNLESEQIWKVVTNIRRKYLSETNLNELKNCQFDQNLEFIEKLEEVLDIKATDIVHSNVSDKTLETASRIFTYITFLRLKSYMYPSIQHCTIIFKYILPLKLN